MKDLVTDAAIDAASGYTDWQYQQQQVLEAAAPFIAAEALRQAADQAEDNYFIAYGYVDNDANEVCVDIRRMADELEGEK